MQKPALDVRDFRLSVLDEILQMPLVHSLHTIAFLTATADKDRYILKFFPLVDNKMIMNIISDNFVQKIQYKYFYPKNFHRKKMFFNFNLTFQRLIGLFTIC